MAGILGSMLIATAFLATRIGAIPAESETIISQIARTVYTNRGILYLATISSTTVILIMAANTAFADFPRLGALHAGDGFLPKQLTAKGSRLVFSRGILPAGDPVQSQRVRFDPIVCHWCFSILYPFPNGDGPPLVEIRAS
jgi:hypothetical protein